MVPDPPLRATGATPAPRIGEDGGAFRGRCVTALNEPAVQRTARMQRVVARPHARHPQPKTRARERLRARSVSTRLL